MERKAESSVAPNEDGLRLADWLAWRFTYLDRAGWEAQVARGSLSVNGKQAGSSLVLAAGDRVSFAPGSAEEPPVDLDYRIVHDDGKLLVVDKPSNLPVHPGGSYFNNSLWSLLRASLPTQHKSAGSAGPEALHVLTRLDRETSGLVLLARGTEAQRHAQRQLDAGVIAKEYLAIVHGVFPGRLEARGLLIVDGASTVRKKRRFVPEGQALPEDRAAVRAETASTDFELVAQGIHPAAGSLSLVRAIPHTGRNHQIRASLYSLGFPLLGDKLYGLDEGFFLRFIEGRLGDYDRQRLLIPAQALHAARLGFADLEGKALEFHAEPPESWPRKCLAELRQDRNNQP